MRFLLQRHQASVLSINGLKETNLALIDGKTAAAITARFGWFASRLATEFL